MSILPHAFMTAGRCERLDRLANQNRKGEATPLTKFPIVGAQKAKRLRRLLGRWLPDFRHLILPHRESFSTNKECCHAQVLVDL